MTFSDPDLGCNGRGCGAVLPVEAREQRRVGDEDKPGDPSLQNCLLTAQPQVCPRPPRGT